MAANRCGLAAAAALLAAILLGCGAEPVPSTDGVDGALPEMASDSTGTVGPAPTTPTQSGSQEAGLSPCFISPGSATPVAGGCRAGPCPSNLELAVNGCICGCEVYDASRVAAPYCCSNGFSKEECPEPLRDDALRASAFGLTEEEIESQLVWTELQGWPVLVHRKALAAFEQVAEAVENSDYRIVEPVDGYSYRNVEGRRVLSPHAYGIAVDVNPSTNPCCGVTQPCRCYNDLITDIPPDFVQAFKNAGFVWGGDWMDHPDPMHFEWEGWLQELVPGSDD